MKKLIFYINTLQIGGAERVLVNLAQQFAAHNYEVILATSFSVPAEYPVASAVRRVSFESRERSVVKKNMNRLLNLRKLCLEERPDLLISFLPEANFRALLVTKGLKIKNLISVRNDPQQEYHSAVYRLLARLLYPGADGCVFQTPDARAWFSPRIRAKSRIIMNQVDDRFYHIVRSGEGRDVVACGRLSEQKNHKMLIEAFAMVADSFPRENLLIYGEGPLRGDLNALVQRLNMQSRIKLMGATQNIPQVLSQAKLFVLSSDFEGMPNALLEALAAGVPSISTDCPCGGPRMVIQDGVNGILLQPGNTGAMAKAILMLLSRPEFALRLGRRAKADAAGFSSENVFGAWKDYVDALASN